MGIQIRGGSDKQNAWASNIATQWLGEIDKEIATVGLRNAAGDKLEWYADKLQMARTQLQEGLAKVTAKQVIDLYTAKISPVSKLLAAARERT